MSKLVLFEKQDVLGFMTDFYRDDEGNLYMTRKQIGVCLGFKNPDNAIKDIHSRNTELLNDHCVYTFVQVPKNKGGANCAHQCHEPNNDKGSGDYYPQIGDSRTTVYQRQKTYLYDEEGIYLVAMKADTATAIKFQKTVAKILKQLRKGYQVWLLEREAGKYARRSLTDTIRDEYPDSPNKKFMYKNFTDLVYKAVTGKTSKQLKEIYGEPLRDNLPPDILKRVKSAECIAKSMVELGCPYSYIKTALSISLHTNEELGQ